MHCFYVEKSQIQEGKIIIAGPDVNHIKNVLRMEKNDRVTICDGDGNVYQCELGEITGKEVLAYILEKRKADTELPSKIYLFQGLPKKDKMEWIIQKAVELGVYEIIPVKTKYCIAKLDEEKKEKKKIERWQAISQAAAKQSGRGIIPKIGQAVDFKQAVELIKGLDAGIIPYELSKGMVRSNEIICKAAEKKTIGVIIGPEGGFSGDEILMAEEAEIKPVSLGKRILRTETAGLSVLSLLCFQMEWKKEAREDEGEGIS